MTQVAVTQAVSASRGFQGLPAALHTTLPSLKATTARAGFLFWVCSRVLPAMASAQMK